MLERVGLAQLYGSSLRVPARVPAPGHNGGVRHVFQSAELDESLATVTDGVVQPPDIGHFVHENHPDDGHVLPATQVSLHQLRVGNGTH